MHNYFQTKEISYIEMSFNIPIHGEKQLLFFTLILKTVDRGNVNFQWMRKMHNDPNAICLSHCKLDI